MGWILIFALILDCHVSYTSPPLANTTLKMGKHKMSLLNSAHIHFGYTHTPQIMKCAHLFLLNAHTHKVKINNTCLITLNAHTHFNELIYTHTYDLDACSCILQSHAATRVLACTRLIVTY